MSEVDLIGFGIGAGIWLFVFAMLRWNSWASERAARRLDALRGRPEPFP